MFKQFKIQPQRLEGEFLVIGQGDSAGYDEFAVLYDPVPTGGWVLFTWGMDYGSGFQHIVHLTEDELNEIKDIDEIYKVREWLNNKKKLENNKNSGTEDTGGTSTRKN